MSIKLFTVTGVPFRHHVPLLRFKFQLPVLKNQEDEKVLHIPMSLVLTLTNFNLLGTKSKLRMLSL